MGVVAPGGVSNALPIEVVAASPNAPRLVDVTLNNPTFDGRGATYSGTLHFEDADGDLYFSDSNAALIRLMVVGTTADYITAFSASGSAGAFTETRGQKQGEIRFSFKMSYIFFARHLSGSIPVAVTIMDAAGNMSNVVSVAVNDYYFGI